MNDATGFTSIPPTTLADIPGREQVKLAEEADQSLDTWEQAHRVRINTILSQNGFEG
jgi:4-hydroxy-4-methyl-2-oxoglutarate aldolase